MYNKRRARLVLDGPGGTFGAVVSEDVRAWAAGETQTLEGRVDLPSGLAPGTYTLSLWLPDESAALAQRSEYAVRFANEGVWDAATARNVLGTVEVSAQGPGTAADNQVFGWTPTN